MVVTRKKPIPPAKRMNAYRARMRAAGLRPVTIWLPDVRSASFEAKVRKQCKAIAAHDPAGEEIDRWIEAMYEWPEA